MTGSTATKSMSFFCLVGRALLVGCKKSPTTVKHYPVRGKVMSKSVATRDATRASVAQSALHEWRHMDLSTNSEREKQATSINRV